jgi:hypothetical protein
MIGHFPDPYPDELFYSICARFSERMQYPNKRSLVLELFGSTNAIACVSLPSHLDYFVAQMPPHCICESDQIIDEHTLLPFFAPFLPVERHHRLRQDMRSGNGPALHMRAGIMASRVPLPEWLRFCPQCVEEDRNRFSESYWHRIHQVPGIDICPLHHCRVKNSSARVRNARVRYEFITAEQALREILPESFERDKPYSELSFALAHDAWWLLSQRGLDSDLTSLQKRYQRRLAYLALASYRGRVQKDALLSQFKQMYTSDQLQALHCELDETIEDCWLIRLIHKPDNAQHPLHHLLLMHCLELTAERFFRLPTTDKPFGEGPWPCLNPACVHYLKSEVKDCAVAYSSSGDGRPIGRFSCACGFIYSRTGPDRSAEDRLMRERIETFGPLWETKLSQLWANETLSLRAIARQLGVDPLTVKRHATRIGLVFPRPVQKSAPLPETRQLHPRGTGVPEQEQLENHRAVWLATMRNYPNEGTKALRSKVPSVYTWLYRNDPVWLKEQSPPPVTRDKQRKPSVDWSDRDQQLAKLIEASAEGLRNVPGRPSRVSLSAIGRDIGQLSLLQQHLDKLPMTAQLLSTVVETQEAFAIRRLAWAAGQFRQMHIQPKRYELIKKAGIGRSLSDSPVMLALEEELKNFTRSNERSLSSQERATE